ncbi:MAG TPA: hypothetical protein VGN69_00050 [Solirubrobacteraceae bacterium]|jgi:hypothetical protein|nr:hypothetical protein [Solirubrobacteraceae bacterium]
MSVSGANRRAADAGHKIALRDPFWPAQLTVAVAIVLNLLLPDNLVIGPAWVIPALEGALLGALMLATPHPDVRYRPLRRYMAMALIGMVSVVNLVSLVLLAHYLTAGGHVNGRPLITAGILLWVNNVLLFGLWYWETDRGGPVARAREHDASPDFLFPQMQATEFAPKNWMPGFIDYMYVSFTNATAFSPTDTMPLTQTAKVMMSVQSLAALITVALVVSRAVNILT